jgi:hypothetical protein
VTVGGRPDAKFARAWGLSLPPVVRVADYDAGKSK